MGLCSASGAEVDMATKVLKMMRRKWYSPVLKIAVSSCYGNCQVNWVKNGYFSCSLLPRLSETVCASTVRGGTTKAGQCIDRTLYKWGGKASQPLSLEPGTSNDIAEPALFLMTAKTMMWSHQNPLLETRALMLCGDTVVWAGFLPWSLRCVNAR